MAGSDTQAPQHSESKQPLQIRLSAAEYAFLGFEQFSSVLRNSVKSFDLPGREVIPGARVH